MNFPEEFLSALTKLEASLKCSICTKKFTNPVRIKTCGHYFCKNCFKSTKQDHNCPICDRFYELQHLDYDPLCNSMDNELAELREIIESVAVQPASKVSKNDKDILKTNKNLGETHPKVNRRLPQNNPEPDKQEQNQNNSKANKKIAENLNNNSIILYENNKYQINYITNMGKPNAKGETPLHTACRSKPSITKFNRVKALIESKVDINAKDFAGWAPLHEATDAQNLQVIEYLLESHCLINIPGCDFSTPLHQAVTLENVDMVRILLKYGANKDMIDYHGCKPCDYSTNQDILDVVQKQDVFDRKETFQVFLCNNIQIYCHSLHEEVKQKLVEADNIHVHNQMGKKLTHFAIKKTHKLSFKILQAMLEGLQFITEESVDDYVRGEYFINIPEYIFLQNDEQLNRGIRKAMISAILKLPKLFEGINFHIEEHTKPVVLYNLKAEKEHLQKLIQAGGGRLLLRPPAPRTCESEFKHPFFARKDSNTFRCCDFIIYEDDNPPELMYRMDVLQHRSSKWLIDCIIKYEILD